MDIITSLIIVAVAGLAHASFQLSVSMFTLLSSHTIGKKRSFARLLTLTNAFIFGVGVMTLLLLCSLALSVNYIGDLRDSVFAWAAGCGLLLGVGVSVAFFYYRREQGTTLWVPRGVARYLGERTKATKHSAEAFGLGLSSVIGELLFTIAPLAIASLIIVRLDTAWQLAAIGIYLLTSMLGLLIVSGMVGAGHSLSKIQKWRESNKTFLQFTAGGLLVALGIYVYVDRVILTNALLSAGGF